MATNITICIVEMTNSFLQCVDGLPVTGAAVSLRRVEGLELLFHISAARGWC